MIIEYDIAQTNLARLGDLAPGTAVQIHGETDPAIVTTEEGLFVGRRLTLLSTGASRYRRPDEIVTVLPGAKLVVEGAKAPDPAQLTFTDEWVTGKTGRPSHLDGAVIGGYTPKEHVPEKPGYLNAHPASRNRYGALIP